jgi:hypothetical protein
MRFRNLPPRIGLSEEEEFTDDTELPSGFPLCESHFRLGEEGEKHPAP